MKMAILRVLSIVALNLLCLIAAAYAKDQSQASGEALAGIIEEYCGEEPGIVQFQWGSRVLEAFPEAVSWPTLTQPSPSAREAAQAAISGMVK